MSDSVTLLIKPQHQQHPQNTTNKFSSRKTWKNLIICTIAFTLTMSGYLVLQSIQSSLYRQQGLGTTGLSVRYLFYALGSLMLAPLMMKVLTHKWTIVIGMAVYVIWIIGIAMGTWTSIIISSVFHGTFSAGLFAGECAYVTELARVHSETTGEIAEKTRMLFFSVIGLFLPVSYLISDVMLIFILKDNSDTQGNQTAINPEENVEMLCGVYDCPMNGVNPSNFQQPSSHQVYILVVSCLALSVCGTLLTIFALDSVPSNKLTNNKNYAQGTCSKLLSVVKLFGNSEMLLLIPLSCTTAIIPSLINGTFNSSWVTCAYGMWMVGLISIPGYILAVPTSLITTYLTKRFGRTFPMLCSFIIGFTMCVFLYVWPVTSNNTWMGYTIFCMYSIHSFLMNPILNCVLGSISLFEDTDAAFSFYFVIYSAMSAGFFFVSYILCSDVKVLISAVSLLISFPCYFVVEFHFMKN